MPSVNLPTLPQIRKPLLRGYIHAAAAVAAAIVGAALVAGARPDAAKQATIAVFVLSSLALFGTSALYHIGHWPPRVAAALRRIDHANIYVVIAGTYTPICFNLLSGWARPAILAVIWCAAVAGVATVAPSVRLPSVAVAALYVGMGWIGIVTAPAIVQAAGAGGLMLIIGGGALYSLGAATYAWKRPRLWPRVFGYHEAFHVLTVMGSALFFSFIATEVLPHTRT